MIPPHEALPDVPAVLKLNLNSIGAVFGVELAGFCGFPRV
jgi:hypothetical protein